MKLVILAIIMGMCATSCNMITGSGRIISENRNVAKFDEIETSSSIPIEVRIGDKYEVRVESDDNILSRIKTSVDDGKLNVYYEEGSYKNVEAKVYVVVPRVTKLRVSGSADITSSDTLSSDGKITLEIDGSGSIDVLVKSPEVRAEVNGSGSISVQGRTRNLITDNSGSGSINASGLLSETSTVENSGSGSTHVFASVNLNADLNGSGDIVYDGNPPSKKIDDDGSGSIRAGK